MKKLLFIIATLVLVGCQPLQQMRQDEILVAVGYASVSEQTAEPLKKDAFVPCVRQRLMPTVS